MLQEFLSNKFAKFKVISSERLFTIRNDESKLCKFM